MRGIRVSSDAQIAETRDKSQKELQAVKEEKDEMIVALEAKLEISGKELKATLKSELEQAKHDNGVTVAELTKTIERAAKDAAKVLQTTEEKAKADITAVVGDCDAFSLRDNTLSLTS